jgi:hypothetical protein
MYDTTVPNTVVPRQNSRFLLLNYSYSRPQREVRRKNRKSNFSFRIPHHAPGRLFEGVACPSASGRDLMLAKNQNLQLRNRVVQ